MAVLPPAGRIANKEHIDKKRSELTEQQIQLCVSVLKTTDCYDQLETLEKATPKQLLAMRSLRKDIRSTISNAFVDVMVNLKERYPTLTGDETSLCPFSSVSFHQSLFGLCALAAYPRFYLSLF